MYIFYIGGHRIVNNEHRNGMQEDQVTVKGSMGLCSGGIVL